MNHTQKQAIEKRRIEKLLREYGFTQSAATKVTLAGWRYRFFTWYRFMLPIFMFLVMRLLTRRYAAKKPETKECAIETMSGRPLRKYVTYTGKGNQDRKKQIH